MMSDPERANIRLILQALKLRLSGVAEQRLFHNASVSQYSRLQAVKLAAESVLNQIQSTCQINSYNVNAKAGEDGKIECDIHVKPTRAAQLVTMTVSLEMMANGFFYVKRIDNKWHLCTERDIYDPGYDPVIVRFGEVEEEWAIYAKEADIVQDVPLDDIRVWSVNRPLKSPCVTCMVKSGESRMDKDLHAGIHCDSCWKEIVFEARRKSW